MRRKYIYYRGDFSSQFYFLKRLSQKPNSKGSKGKFFDLNIGAKKELNNPEQITEKEYNELTLDVAQIPSVVDVHYNDGKTFSYRFRKGL